MNVKLRLCSMTFVCNIVLHIIQVRFGSDLFLWYCDVIWQLGESAPDIVLEDLISQRQWYSYCNTTWMCWNTLYVCLVIEKFYRKMIKTWQGMSQNSWSYLQGNTRTLRMSYDIPHKRMLQPRNADRWKLINNNCNIIFVCELHIL